MRKTICTATIFAAMVGGVIGLVCLAMRYPDMAAKCILFLAGLLLASIIVQPLWEAASAICSKLRGEKAQQ